MTVAGRKGRHPRCQGTRSAVRQRALGAKSRNLMWALPSLYFPGLHFLQDLGPRALPVHTCFDSRDPTVAGDGGGVSRIREPGMEEGGMVWRKRLPLMTLRLSPNAVQVLVDGAPVRIELWDTAGQEDFDRLRSLCYPDTDVFLACFSVVQPGSFQNITEKWLPEIRTHNPQAPVLLVGTQADLRDDVNVLIQLDQGGRETPVPHPQAQGLAEKIRARGYLECSALTQKNLKEVFDAAILSAIEHKARLEKKLNAKGVRTLSRCRWKKFFCFV
uniref:Ras homolog family member V n=1 Tax=Monodelphis domestica TaxID=13616 RepID=A0A5F8H1I6_MONDO